MITALSLLITSPIITVSVPLFQTTPPGYLLVAEKIPYVLTCLTYGRPASRVTWLRFNRTLSANSTISLPSNGSLILLNPNNPGDAGIYQCVATNEFASVVSMESRIEIAS